MQESPIALSERSTRPADVDGDSGTLLPLGSRIGWLEDKAPRTVTRPRTGSCRATRRRSGNLLSEFFAAAPTDVTGQILDRGPQRRYETVSATSLTDLTMALLLAAVEGRNLDRAVGRMEMDGFVVEGTRHGPWLTRLPDALRDALGAASAEDLRLYAARWLAAVELAHVEAKATIALLGDLAALARTARSRGETVYLWTSL